MQRFLLPDVRRRFLIARAGLRGILARYLDLHPQGLVFAYGPQGKPALPPPYAALEFNLSHCGDLALLGVAADQALGVDLEQLRPKQNLLSIARRAFPAEQYLELRGLQGDDLLQGFYRCWTAIEARTKAEGQGIFKTLREHTPPPCEVSHLIPAPGFLAAVAAQCLPTHPASWHYLDPGWNDPA